ncbi:MAG TPA: hypothetical protein PL131_00275 [Methylotenera sp.]|nr:hypothetical protein [Methylotenera sp.]HPH04281.1 hypothetical protein [Methylotenera sp.]HPM99835.1 hypothetical protein [Methylotenera sp.]
MIYSVIMLLILLASVAVPLFTKLDDSWGEWTDKYNKPIFPAEHNYSYTIRVLATFLLVVSLTVFFSVISHWSESKPKDQALIFYMPILALPCLVVLTPKKIADAYVIPACKWVFIVVLFLFVLGSYISLFKGVSEHYVTARFGVKIYLEQDAGRFWFLFLGFAFVNGLFLGILKYAFLWLFNKLKR